MWIGGSETFNMMIAYPLFCIEASDDDIEPIDTFPAGTFMPAVLSCNIMLPAVAWNHFQFNVEPSKPVIPLLL